MTTERQIEANRQNAQASTGPRTPGGKVTVSRNAEKHGFFSRHVLIDGEDAEEFDAFAAGMRQALEPVGGLQDLFADRVIAAAWRLRRVAVIEADVFTPEKVRAELMNILCDRPKPPGSMALDESNQHKLGLLIRYEGQVERTFYKSLDLLRSLQRE